MGVSAAEGGRVGVRMSGRTAVGPAGERLRVLLREADEHVIAESGELQDRERAVFEPDVSGRFV